MSELSERSDKKLTPDRKEFLAEVQESGWLILEDADETFKADREIVLTAVKSKGYAFKFADDKLKACREFVLTAVKSNGDALEYADEIFQADQEIALAAIKSNFDAFQFADDTLKADREFVLRAVKLDGWALEYADEIFQADQGIVLAAVRSAGGGTLQFADQKLIDKLKEEGLLEDNSSKEEKQFSFEITFREDEIASACDVYTKLEEDEDVICNDLGPSQDFVWEEMEGEGESISYEFIIKNPERKESIISEIQDDYGMEIDKIQEY